MLDSLIFDAAIERLKAYEGCIKEFGKVEDIQGSLMFARK